MSTAKEHLERCIAAGATQKEIEAKTGVSQATISRILSGEHADPRSSTSTKIKSFRVPSKKRAAEVKTDQVAA